MSTAPAFRVSTDRRELQMEVIHRFLSEDAYWCRGIPRKVLEQAIEHSLCFGVYDGKRQAGFARVVTDYATIAYLADVFVLPEYRGLGLAGMLVEAITGYPALAGLRRWFLATADAHQLYEKYGGFLPLTNPERWMERYDPDIYLQQGKKS